MIFSDAVWRQPALQLERELLAPGVCVDHIDMPSRYFNQTVVWGAPGYFDRIRHRIPAVRRRLEQQLSLAASSGCPGGSRSCSGGSGCSGSSCSGGSGCTGSSSEAAGWLALFDADIAVLRNVSARFARAFADAPQAQLLVQQEWPCSSAPHALCVNGGLWAVRRSAGALALLTRAEWLLERLRVPDQDALQIVASESREAVLFLDRQRYANGFTALHEAQWSAHGAHLVHANWLPSVECKLQWLAHFRATRFHLSSKYEGVAGAMRRRCGVSL